MRACAFRCARPCADERVRACEERGHTARESQFDRRLRSYDCERAVACSSDHHQHRGAQTKSTWFRLERRNGDGEIADKAAHRAGLCCCPTDKKKDSIYGSGRRLLRRVYQGEETEERRREARIRRLRVRGARRCACTKRATRGSPASARYMWMKRPRSRHRLRIFSQI
eukprot:6087786-Pleurochrysis_carterae.AAC.1